MDGIMKILSTNNKIFFLILIILASSISAMEQFPKKYMTKAYVELCQTLISNQSLAQQNSILSQQNYSQQTKIALLALDKLVVNAKKLPKPCDAFSPLAIQYLEKAKVGGHPEARYLLGDIQASRPCQEWRLGRARDEFTFLATLLPQGPNEESPLIGESEAYNYYQEILDHPRLKIPDDLEIRAEAAYILGYLCLRKCGIPLEKANRENAESYFQMAKELGHCYADAALMSIKTYYGAQKSSQPASQQSIDNHAKLPQLQQADEVVYRIDKLAFQATTRQSNPQQKSAILREPSLKQDQQEKMAIPKEDMPTEAQLLAQQIQAREASVKAMLQEIEQIQPAAIIPKEKRKKDKPPCTTSAQIQPQPVSPKPSVSESSKPVTAAAQPIKKTEQKLESAPTEPAFTIKEDLSAQAQENVTTESCTVPFKHKKCTPKIKQLSRKDEKLKKAQDKKETSKKSKSKSATTSDDKQGSDPVERKKKSTPQEKKQKHEKNKNEKVDEQPEESSAEQAFTLTTNLISYYMDSKNVAAIKADFLSQSLDNNWSAKATYEGACQLLGNKYKKEASDVPELLAILKYMQGNLPAAAQFMAKSEKQDSVTAWYRAIIIPSTEKDTEMKNAKTADLINKFCTAPLADFKKIIPLLHRDKNLMEFITTKIDTSKFLRLKLLLMGCDKKTFEAELIAAHKQGSVEDSLLLAQMYAEGTIVEQSHENALSILQESVKTDKAFNAHRAELFKKITAEANAKNDDYSLLHAHYLNILETCKSPEHEKTIPALLATFETILKNVLNKKVFSKKAQCDIADLLDKTGAYETLLPQAEKDDNIACTLFNIATLSEKLRQSNKLQEKYAKIITLNARCVEKKKEARKRVITLVGQYLFESEKVFISQINEKFSTCLTAQDVYSAANDILQKQYTQKESQKYDDLCGILHYLQGHLTIAQQMFDKYDTPLKNAVTFWYHALVLLATKPDSPERNKIIFEYISNATCVPLVTFETLANALVLENELLKFIKEKGSTFEQTPSILALLGIAFGSQYVGMTPEQIQEHFRQGHKNHNINSSIILADMYLYGISFEQSFEMALFVIQKAIESHKEFSQTIIDFMQRFSFEVSKKSDISSYIFASFLCIVEHIKTANEQVIIEILEKMKLALQSSNQGPQLNVADIFTRSGAAKALQPFLQQNTQIKSLMAEILNVSKKQDHDKNQSATQTEGSQKNDIIVAEPVGLNEHPSLINDLLTHYLGNGELTRDLLQEIMARDNTTNFKDFCNLTADIVTKKLKAAELSKPVLVAIFNYLLTEQTDVAIISWYDALINFAAEPETAARNGDILASLQSALSHPQDFYTPAIKKQLVIDQEFIDYLKKLAQTSKIAKAIVARIESIFNENVTEIDYLAALSTEYLAIIHQAKTPCASEKDYNKLLQSMQTAEKNFDGIPADKKQKASKLFYKTGVYQALLERAKENDIIAQELLLEAQKRIIFNKHQTDKYIEILKIMSKKLAPLTSKVAADTQAEYQTGSIASGVQMARYYVYGIGVERSFEKALEIIQKIVDGDKLTPELEERIEILLETIDTSMNVGNRDIMSAIHSLCLHLVLALKKNLLTAEDYQLVLKAITGYASLIKGFEHEIAELFKSSGAHRALQPIAKQNPTIQTQINAILGDASSLCNQMKKTTEDASHLKADPSSPEYMSVILDAVITHYLGDTPDTKRILETLKKLPNGGQSEAYNIVGEHLKKTGKNKPLLMSFLQYGITKNVNKIGTRWFSAFVYFIMNEDCDKRNNGIISVLESALFCPSDWYTPAIKEQLVFDEEYLGFLEKLAVKNERASLVLRRLNFLLRNFKMTEETLNEIEKQHDKKSIPASLWLAESIEQSSRKSQELRRALLILQQAEMAVPNYELSIISHIGRATRYAEENGDFSNAIYGNYLAVAHACKNVNEELFIADKFLRAENLLLLIQNQGQQNSAAKFFKESGAYSALLPIAAQHPHIAKLLGNTIGTRVQQYNHSASDYAAGIEIATNACNASAEKFEELFISHKQITTDPRMVVIFKKS